MVSIVILLSILLVIILVMQVVSCEKESMVTLGTDLSETFDIPGATYGEGGNRGVGIDPPAGYTKVNEGTPTVPIFKMKPIIPDGFKISDNDPKILVPIKETTQEMLTYYQNSTDTQLRQPPYLDIPGVNYNSENKIIGDEAPLPTTHVDDEGNPKVYYKFKLTECKIKLTNRENEYVTKVLPDPLPKCEEEGQIKYVMKQIPDPLPKGYELDKDFLVFNPTLYALSTFDSTFDAKDIDRKYHSDDMSEAPDNNLGVYYQFDQNGNMVKIENTEAQFSPVLYYIPGAYKFGSANYIPNYEDSVYLSRTTRQSQVAPVYNTASALGGFCTQDKNDVTSIEEKCGALDLNTCASTSCCTLLGGQKCVAGNQNGPRNIANYSDYNLKNKDFYYYQGKCYGNCQK
jgi:hypothetical protein